MGEAAVVPQAGKGMAPGCVEELLRLEDKITSKEVKHRREAEEGSWHFSPAAVEQKHSFVGWRAPACPVATWISGAHLGCQ